MMTPLGAGGFDISQLIGASSSQGFNARQLRRPAASCEALRRSLVGRGEALDGRYRAKLTIINDV